MRQITIRNISDEIADKLRALKADRKISINSLILEILNKTLGVSDRKKRLARYATWSSQDAKDFQNFLQEHRKIDKEHWQ